MKLRDEACEEQRPASLVDVISLNAMVRRGWELRNTREFVLLDASSTEDAGLEKEILIF